MLGLINAGLPLRHLEPDFLGVPLHDADGILGGLRVPLVLAFKQAVVHLPELPLISGAGGRVGGGPGVPVHVEREIVECQRDLASRDQARPDVRLGDRGKLTARWAFEIAKLDNLHGRGGVAADVAKGSASGDGWIDRDGL